jgi:ribose transport system ATP-binding protein
MRDGAIAAKLGRDQLSEETIVSHAVGTTASRLGAA